MNYVFEILTTIMFIVAGFLFRYWKTSEKAQQLSEKITTEAVAFAKIIAQMADELIARAEVEYEGTGRGKEKFKFVVDTIMLAIPDPLEVFFTREVVELIVEGAFQAMKDFAGSQIDKVLDQIMPDVEGTPATETEASEN